MDAEYALSHFCASILKAELHAHLHGSIRSSTLESLIRVHLHDRKELDELEGVLRSPSRSLSDCFKIFDLIHKVVDSETVLRRIVNEVVADFFADKVAYLELRTTPRVISGGREEGRRLSPHILEESTEHNLDAELLNYFAIVLETAATAVLRLGAEGSGAPIVRWLVSINRARSVEEAWRIMRIAVHLSTRLLWVWNSASALGEGASAVATLTASASSSSSSSSFYSSYSASSSSCHPVAGGTGSTADFRVRMCPGCSAPPPSECACRLGRWIAAGVVGVDLGGDPTRGDVSLFLPALRWVFSILFSAV